MMGWEDRDYHRDEEGTARAFGGGGLGRYSVVTWLLAINVVLWLGDRVFTGSERANILSPFGWMNFNIVEGIYGWQVWRFVTYQFIHSLTDFIHVFFNMMILLALGPSVEQWWGSKRFLAFYLFCGTSGAFVFSLLYFAGILHAGHVGMPLVGASGSIYGICIAAAVVYPTQKLKMLWLPFEFSLRVFALIILGIAFLSIMVGSGNAGGEAAHLGGAALGFLFVKFPASLAWVEKIRLPRKSAAASWEKKMRKQRDTEAKEQAEVDRILDKVRDHGLHSLSKTEKRILQRATDRQRRAG